MAQQFQVLRCCSCNVFQVQQVKKSKKWNCKICDEKQSILKVFGQGSGSDCRCHVQKLNLLQGEAEQAPMNILRHTEEPVERVGEHTAVKLEENLGWQEEKVELSSRWTKYLEKKCEEHEKKEDEIVHTEKQTYPSKRNIAKDPRKRKTNSHPTDAQGFEEKRVAGFAKKSFENRRHSATVVIKRCGDVICKSVMAPAVEEFLECGKNKESASKGATLSKWEKFLSSEESYNSGDMTTTVEQSQGTLLPMPTTAASDQMAANCVSIIPCNRHHVAKENASILLDTVHQVSSTEHIRALNIPVGRSTESLTLVSGVPQRRLDNLFNRGPASSFSTSPHTVSNVGLYRSLFSTDDFDDHL